LSEHARGEIVAAKVIWERVNKIITTTIRVALILGCTWVSGLMGAEIVSRTIFGHPLMFVQDLAVYTIVWVYMLGAIYTTYERRHLKGAIMDSLVKNPKTQRRIAALHAAFSAGFSCLLSVWGFETFVYDLEMDPRTAMLLLPLAYARLSLFVGFALITIYFIREFVVLQWKLDS